MSTSIDWIERARALLTLVSITAEHRERRHVAAYRAIAQRARRASEQLGADPECDPLAHAYWLELEMFGWFLHNALLPARRIELCEALERTVQNDRDADNKDVRNLLSVIHPGLVIADVPNLLHAELGIVESLMEFGDGSSVAVLHEALLAACLHADTVVALFGHPLCTYPVTRQASWVLQDVLLGLLPAAHQYLAARSVSGDIWRLYARPDEHRYSFDTAPEMFTKEFFGIANKLLLPRDDAPPFDDPWLDDVLEDALEPYKDFSGYELYRRLGLGQGPA